MVRRSRRGEKLSLAFVLALGIAAACISALAITGLSLRDVGDALHAAPADGSWKAVSFDHASVRSKNYLLAIRRGRVVGGYDGCNGWSYEDQEPDRNGDRRVLSTLVQCSTDEGPRRLYRILAYAPKVEILSDNELRLSRNGHQGIFRRCKPDHESRRCVEVR